jgi:hypothetical protein
MLWLQKAQARCSAATSNSPVSAAGKACEEHTLSHSLAFSCRTAWPLNLPRTASTKKLHLAAAFRCSCLHRPRFLWSAFIPQSNSYRCPHPHAAARRRRYSRAFVSTASRRAKLKFTAGTCRCAGGHHSLYFCLVNRAAHPLSRIPQRY